METASDIGRLNSVKFQLERDVDEMTRKVGTMTPYFWKRVGRQGSYKNAIEVIFVKYG
jgi:hypothetical protein